ncbi:MAG: hypothetical protein IT221_16160 [Fluviicola sp.]|nr:hypothetical protein [Fluviicola sp.]
MKKSIYFVIAFTFVLTSCNNSAESEHGHDHGTHQHEDGEVHENHDHSSQQEEFSVGDTLKK